MGDEKIITDDEISTPAEYLFLGFVVSFLGSILVAAVYDLATSVGLQAVVVSSAMVSGGVVALYVVGWVSKRLINRTGTWLERGGYL